MDYTKYEMLNTAFKTFGDLGDDEELGPVDWPTVKRYIRCLNDLEGVPMHPHSASETGDSLDPTNLRDIRIRLLNGLYFILFALPATELFYSQCISSCFPLLPCAHLHACM